jgi:crossover junction endodeoxyribonuclease RuvC
VIALGIDPGFASLGFAAVELSAVVRVPRCWVERTEPSAKKRDVRQSEDLVRRCRELTVALERTIAEWHPAVACAETMSWPRDMKAATRVALAWGVIAAVLERHGIALVQASPQEVKKAMCGSKSASKEDVQLAVEERVEAVTWPTQKTLVEHAADAVAVVLTCADSDVVRAAMRARDAA